MKRLTYRNTDGSVGINAYRYYNYEDFQELTNKLADYEDAEEQGLLLKLPCKIGTPVWAIMNSIVCPNPSLFEQNFGLDMLDYFGKTVFLTKEEAEQALAEMKGGKNG